MNNRACYSFAVITLIKLSPITSSRVDIGGREGMMHIKTNSLRVYSRILYKKFEN